MNVLRSTPQVMPAQGKKRLIEGTNNKDARLGVWDCSAGCFLK